MLKTFLLSCIALAMGALQNFGGTLPSDPRLYTALILGEKGIGSGCLLQSSNAIYLVTARHVLFGEASGTNSRPLISSFAVIKSHYTTDSNKLDSVDFTIHLDQLLKDGQVRYHTNHDVALVRIGGPRKGQPGLRPIPGVDVRDESKHISVTEVKSTMKLKDVDMGADAYMIGYPVSLTGPMAYILDPTEPLIRKGVVSGVQSANGVIVIDCPSYFGNSGGPVFEVDRVSAFQYNMPLIGIVVSFVPFQEEWENKTMHYSHTVASNSGLTIVEPMDSILEMMWD